MLKKLLDKKKQEGFTIVEVMIVLAIAGLIILVVFLAVPALQRNSRNTQRNNDASLIGAAVNECLNNRNGNPASCNTNALIVGPYLDTSKLRQLSTVTLGSGTGGINAASVVFGQKCSSDGSTASSTGASARAAVTLYSVETSSGSATRCLDI